MSNIKNKPTYGPTYTLSGSQSASVKYTVKNVASAIQNVAGNIIAPMSGSGYLYAPYVPLQVTSVGKPKSILQTSLFSNSKLKEFEIALAKKYIFLWDYMKVMEDREVPTIFEFKIDDMFFISEIIQKDNFFHAYPITEPSDNEYTIKVVSLNADANTFSFKDSEFINLLEKQVIIEKP